MRVFAKLLEAIEVEGAAVLVTLLAAEGSSPREAGARMVVRPSGGFHGTIGGGTLEWEVLAEARRLFASGRGPAQRLAKSLGPDLGQCCGGRVRLLLEIFDARDRVALLPLAEREALGPLATEAALDGEGRLVRLLLDATGSGSTAIVLLPDGRIKEYFGDAATPVLLFGAGHVGRALVLALAPLPFSVSWIDSRPEAFPSAVPRNVTVMHAPDPATALAQAPAAAFVAVMTHSHPLDLAIVAQALKGERFAYVGLIGSQTKRARFVSRLRAAGFPEREIGRLVCPIGLPGIDGKEPAVIAASVAADFLLRRQSISISHHRDFELKFPVERDLNYGLLTD